MEDLANRSQERARTILTIGHSTRTFVELVALLREARIELLVDVSASKRSNASMPEDNRRIEKILIANLARSEIDPKFGRSLSKASPESFESLSCALASGFGSVGASRPLSSCAVSAPRRQR
jgi:hypothetical protein